MQVIKSIQVHQQKNISHKKQDYKEKVYNLSVHRAEGYTGKTAKNLRESFKENKDYIYQRRLTTALTSRYYECDLQILQQKDRVDLFLIPLM